MSLSVDQLLAWLLIYGYPFLFFVVLVSALGAPLPANILLLAAGGFVAQGSLDLWTVLGLVLLAAILGDCVLYSVFRWAGEALVHRHGHRIGVGSRRLDAVRTRFGSWLGLSVFFTRWLLTPFALPATVLAGISHYPVVRFAALVIAGESLWTSGFVALGYIFGESWSSLMETVSDSVGVIAGLGITGAAVWLLVVQLRSRGTTNNIL